MFKETSTVTETQSVMDCIKQIAEYCHREKLFTVNSEGPELMSSMRLDPW